MATLQPIPEPRGALPFLGHALVIDGNTPLNSLEAWTLELGELYTFRVPNKTLIVAGSQKLAQELCDEKRFRKNVRGTVLEDIRVLVHDGLFTAYHGEENWGVAHRVLVPAFGPAGIMAMFDDMYDILSQLVLKWERFGPKHSIDPTDDFTRLAFDTIAFCAMTHRLNSFYTEGVPPFVQAMGDFLSETDHRSRRPGIVNRFMSSANAKYEADIKMMSDLAREIVEERRANPTEKKDLLNAMLNGRDAQTGKQLSDQSIMDQMITFLIAGHETTSGLLSFLMYEVLKHPEVYAKLREEIDNVVGQERMRAEHLAKLPYLTATMREVLRMRSPINFFGVAPFEDEVLGGKYLIKKDQPVAVFVRMVHRDPEVYGDDATEFKPERMLNGNFEALPPKSWLPFGNGARACIGRAFAWQEAQIAVVTLFQKFNFRLADPSYTLHLKQTLTVKPQGLRIHAIPRTDTTFSIGLAPTLATSRKAGAQAPDGSGGTTAHATADASQPLYVLYGSNTGSCEMFAQRLANEAADHGFCASIGTLDSAAKGLPTDGAVIIITASFEGEPPDNAGHFVKYLESLSSDNAPLAGVRYAVFGCGNHDWVHTFQRIPKLFDSIMTSHGAERLLERGEADAAGARFFESFDDWEGKLWAKLAEAYDIAASDTPARGITVEVSAPTQRASQLRQPDAQLGIVLQNRLLTKPGVIDKHHLEIQLPEGMTYRAGDYLAILPSNPESSVRRVISLFNLTAEQELKITSSTPTTLPTHRPVNVHEVLSGYVELEQPATRKNIEQIMRHAPVGKVVDDLQRLIEHYVPEVLEKRLSVLSILEAHPGIDLPLASFLGMLPAMRVRQYSISSSPLWHPGRVTLTLGVLRGPSLADSGELFQGVASTFLASLQPGDRVQVVVRLSNAAFHLPATPETPIVMFASGSGFAPMRGFIQERAAQKAAGRTVGRALLFFGCRSPEADFLYADAELKDWIAQGVVEVRPAFSRAPELSAGCRYVQERVWHDRAEVIEAFRSDAKFYTCGSARVALGIKEACMHMVQELKPDADAGAPNSLGKLSPEEFWATIQNERYAADIFG
ncbi:NADPH-cytochrome P450 reductase-like protein [Auricularia subglabra TFB-10046 SS5]|nr:NADPH-cytochrome P450 reductase-like protein [Auricularia subglabra TFB-10046 SS5]